MVVNEDDTKMTGHLTDLRGIPRHDLGVTRATRLDRRRGLQDDRGADVAGPLDHLVEGVAEAPHPIEPRSSVVGHKHHEDHVRSEPPHPPMEFGESILGARPRHPRRPARVSAQR